MRLGIQYIIRDVEARMLDTNIGGEPLFLMVESGCLLPAIEQQLHLMKKGQWSRFLLGPADLYGEYETANCMLVDYNDINQYKFSIGDWVWVKGGRVGMVLQLLRNVALVDFNHPLAGRSLDIEIGLIEVEE
ncbi:hypothetical protein [Flavihumibacter sp. CACIAM 22H1]|uniref:FKBP-type peptidyl-prolyl cis-trans isomerase n=1 Tax=Flavihumibacter sp. CACIAM 22H1 TaxID=1812911 RepID=UPI0007A8D145|nr:hypothetical protein [Flavihumibacter sp. CACIAM 22H1]KYP16602.1 MAG: hypothetical protein A1D16_09310 [Flavihumibacter sp. CACIAM 22H1]